MNYLRLPTAPKSYILKQKSHALGFTELQSQRVRNYVIAFDNKTIARSVHYCIHPNPSFRLERGSGIDISTDVNRLLLDSGVHTVSETITIDVLAQLYIPKMQHPGGMHNPLNDGGFHLEELLQEDVYMYPFEKNIGVIIPHAINWESGSQMVFFSQVIEPVDSIKQFRKTLELE
jgi:hypothetical protein